MKTALPDALAVAPRAHAGRRQPVLGPHDGADGEKAGAFAKLLVNRCKSDAEPAESKDQIAEGKQSAGGFDMVPAALQLASLIAQAPMPPKRGDVQSVHTPRDAIGPDAQEPASAPDNTQKCAPLLPSYEAKPLRQANPALALPIVPERPNDVSASKGVEPAKQAVPSASGRTATPVVTDKDNGLQVKPIITEIKLETHLAPTASPLSYRKPVRQDGDALVLPQETGHRADVMISGKDGRPVEPAVAAKAIRPTHPVMDEVEDKLVKPAVASSSPETPLAPTAPPLSYRKPAQQEGKALALPIETNKLAAATTSREDGRTIEPAGAAKVDSPTLPISKDTGKDKQTKPTVAGSSTETPLTPAPLSYRKPARQEANAAVLPIETDQQTDAMTIGKDDPPIRPAVAAPVSRETPTAPSPESRKPARQEDSALVLPIISDQRCAVTTSGKDARPIALAVAAAADHLTLPVMDDKGHDKRVRPTVAVSSFEAPIAPVSPSLPLTANLGAASDAPVDVKPAAQPLAQLPPEQPLHKPLQVLKVHFDHETTGPLSATLKLRHNLIAVQLEAKDEALAISLRDDAAKLALDLKSSGYALDGVSVQAARSDAARNDANPNPSRQPPDLGGQPAPQDHGQSSTPQSAGEDAARRQARRKQEQGTQSHEENRRGPHTRTGGVYL